MSLAYQLSQIIIRLAHNRRCSIAYLIPHTSLDTKWNNKLVTKKK